MEASQDVCYLICRKFLLQKHRWRKFVLHCNRCTAVRRFFNLIFVRIKKEGTLGTGLISKKKIVWTSQLLWFRLTWKKFLNCAKWSGKEEKPQVSKWKRATRIGHASFFFFFFFWDLELVPIDSALNPASGHRIHFAQKCSHGTKKCC